ncbi:MAG TPA: cytochrome P450 [Cyanobacteria bacterium UBA11372]|nr:cytochrome P450 [Cyanobacteria bacterium UBA11372]
MKLPPGPQAPHIIQLIHWIANPLDYLESFSQRYGDIFTARWSGFAPFVILSNPQAIQEVLTTDAKQFHSGEGNQLLRPLVGNYSMFLLDGERHQRQRQLLTPPFHGERMKAYGKLICDITTEVIGRERLGKAFRVRSAMQEVSLRVILDAVFGMNEGERFNELKQILAAMLDAVSSPVSSSVLFLPSLQRDFGDWSPWGSFIRRQKRIDQLVYTEIRQRRQDFDPNSADILTLMMSARDAKGQAMSDEELHDELLTLLLAGHETTASAIAWALYWIHHLPEVRDKLLKELDNLGGELDPSTVMKLPYLTAVCQETLRIYPVAMLTSPRIVQSPYQLMGYEFEPGTVISPCIYLTHHREDLYPEPKRFKPERFLERQFSPYEYFPFGGSDRRCIGMAFAQYEMKLVLATILSRWELALADNRPVAPVRRGVTLAPPTSLKMVVTGQRTAAKIPVQV